MAVRGLRVAGILGLTLLVGCTEWLTVAAPPQPTPPVIRVRPAGRSAWLVLRDARVEGDSLLVWPVVTTDARRVPQAVRGLYEEGRLPLREIREIQIAGESVETSTGRTAARALVVVGGIVVAGIVAVVFFEEMFFGWVGR